MNNQLLYTAFVTAMLPLLGSIIGGLFGKQLGRTLTHRVLITLVSISFILSVYLFNVFVIQGHAPVDGTLYTWATAGVIDFDIGLLIDPLSAAMSVVVLFVSLMVHIYTIGYMADDGGYQRFFSYVSLFTFAMLMLVLANNFLLLFFGWEGVGVVSYLLIGFWYQREAAVFGSLKAFLVNRIGDVGFLVAIAAVLMCFASLTYHDVFPQAALVANKKINILPGYDVSAISLICLLLFTGAMAKSAQVPMHVWLPESMEGPTPISALIHAATMVTAGIYMVARMSPLFEYSPETLSLILVLGGTTAFFMGLVAIVQNDIKRVIAYSTISQLGYMAVALGASAYNVAIFHLITHAFFKALLFLGAGSVIIAMHHEQDMRKMGGLAKYMPVTYFTFVIGSLALCAIPPFAGFFSKEMIIDAAHHSTMPGANYAYWCVLLGAFVTPVYTFRALFMTFHTKERMGVEMQRELHESPWVVTMPLVLLAIPSLVAGQIMIGPMLFAKHTWLGNSVFVLPQHNPMTEIASHFKGANWMALEAGATPAFWLSVLGILIAWAFTSYRPVWSAWVKERFNWVYNVLAKKYGFDDFNQIILVRGTRNAGQLFYSVSDVKLIDDACVNGSGKFVTWLADKFRYIQTGYLYQYALVMILGMLGFLLWYVGGY